MSGLELFSLSLLVAAFAGGAFGYSLIGAAPRKLLDMSPFERSRDGHGVQTDGGRRVEPWLPYQYRWRDVLALGGVVGILGGYIAYLTGSAFLAFGVSVVVLFLVSAGVPKIPITHHMSLPASTAVLASVDAPLGSLTPAVVAGALPLGEALVLGAVFGTIGALFGEVAQRVFYAHAETHLDPPAASIVVTSLLIGVLAILGVFPSSAWVPLP